jgi:hypothetical protein
VLVYKGPEYNEDDLPQKSPFFSEDWWKTDSHFVFVIYLHWLTCWRTDYPTFLFNVWHIIFKMTINQSSVYLRAFCWFSCALDFHPLHTWRSRKKICIKFISDSFSCNIVILK